MLSKNMKILRIIFVRLVAEGLNVSAPKCSFGLKCILYLCYVITQEGIKLHPKKVQGIMDIGIPTTTTEEQELISTIQYYRYMFPRQYHILDFLIEATSFRKGRKII